jgi:hypothetical protein
MATKYRLPCHEDAFVAVDASQAGLSVTCPCGKEVQVPTWSELSRLDRVEAALDDKSTGRGADAPSTWSPQKGLIFLGALILIASAASATYWWVTMPRKEPIFVNYDGIREHTESLTLTDSMKEWDELRKGMPEGELPPMRMYFAMQETHGRWTYVSLAGCVVGAALCLTGLATGGKSGRRVR